MPRSIIKNTIWSTTLIILLIFGCGGGSGGGSTPADPAANTGTASLSWTPPTTNTDDTPLTDLAGYKIYFGTDSGNYTETITVNDSTINSYVVDDLAANTWYFAVAAFDTSGNESTKSNEATKEITP